MTGAVFLDIKAAYDNVNRQILFSVIDSFSIPTKIKTAIKNLLYPRSVDFYESGCWIANRYIQKGLPQGSALGPLLFNIYVKDILWQIPHNCKTIQFADDIAILSTDGDLNIIKNSLTTAFINVEKWLNSLGLDISIPKTQAIIFNRKRSTPNEGELIIDTRSLKLQKVAKYLGMTLDEGLRWKNHIQSLRVKTMKYNNILKWLAGSSWGVNLRQSLSFANATIRLGAQLDWGSMWFINAACSNIKVLERILCNAFKIAIGLPRSTPNRVAWKFSNQNCLLNRISAKTDKYMCKLIQLKSNAIINKIKNFHTVTQVKQIAKRNIPFIVKRWPVIKPYEKYLAKWDFHPTHICPFQPDLEEVEVDVRSGYLSLQCNNPNNAFVNLINLNCTFNDEITIYTDGSRTELNDGSFLVGSGIFIYNFNTCFKYKLNSYSSSFSPESIAIKKAIELAVANNWSYINICSDSQSNLDIIGSSSEIYRNTIKKLNPTIEAIRSEILRFKDSGGSIRFTWCPAHKNIIGNENADNAAKEAALIGEVVDNQITYSEIISSLKNSYAQINLDYLHSINIGTGNYYMNSFANINVNTLSKFGLSRKHQCILIRVITGYPYTNSVKKKFGLRESMDCKCGFEAQDSNHIFWACPNYNDSRRVLYGKLLDYKCQTPFSIEYIISVINKRIAKAMVNFGWQAVKHVLVATPRANGQVERFNRVITPMLAKLSEQPNRWEKTLSAVEFALNNSVCRSTGETPSRLLFGIDQLGEINDNLRLELELEEERDLSALRNSAAEKLQKASEQMEKNYNSKRKPATKYQVGDYIMISNRDTTPGVNKKLIPKFKGPYVVTKVLDNDRYVIEDIEGFQVTRVPFTGVVSPDQMKPWIRY
ncbi:uncharacterized protein LOC118645052 [Monomorium pharaonis]|uniref:uncharacterized protein LOC118645052 n=1 Tax=Monomorium pharaonis TaxID=307658 RepID=UPI001745D4D6|nr:uncharacterized protein LOC118645052 [Monomorium pharaonis]XP_036141246.1 uncharacterized protein LOC118645052 [Monomorium pharaonis]